MHKAKPFLRARSAYDLPLGLLKEKGIKAIFFDMDNTLASYYETFSDREEEAKRLKDALTQEGFSIFLASNGKGKRVMAFAESWGVKSYHMLLKPFAKRLRKAVLDSGLLPEEAILVGDQMMTDMKAARKAGLYFALTDPLSDREPCFTKINRFFERKNRKKIAKLPYNEWIEW